MWSWKLYEFSPYIVAFLLYPPIASLILKAGPNVRWSLFAAFNILTSFAVIFFSFIVQPLRLEPEFGPMTLMTACGFALYVGFVLLCRQVMIKSLKKDGPIVILAYMLPISLLLIFRYGVNTHLVIALVGVSYLSLRLCQLVSEVRCETVAVPTAAQYLAFAFFVPIIFVGPITQYAAFKESVDQFSGCPLCTHVAALRMLVGAVKFFFFSAVLAGITYGTGFLLDGHLHSWLDLVVAVLVYPCYLYCNFSGLCDVAIGASALCGIRVTENFNRPFSSRNFQEFWTRWHITLSALVRDLVFTPLVKTLTRRMGAAALPAATVLGILAVFLIIGAWHGLEPHFILFGISQGIGVAFVFLTGRLLKKHLSKQNYLAYMKNPGWRFAGVVATYLYFAVTMFLFANKLGQAQLILARVR